MDFDFTEEQRLLDETVRRLVKDEYGFEKRKGYKASPDGFSRKLWQSYAEIGLLGLPFAEDHGGFGGSLRMRLSSSRNIFFTSPWSRTVK